MMTGCATLPTVELHGDYLSYDTPVALVADATIIVEGTVVDKEPVTLLPRYDPADPDDAYYGVPNDVREKDAAQDEGVPAQAVSLRVDAVHVGEFSVGSIVVFLQTGGVVNGVRYLVDSEPELVSGERYLLFGKDSFDGRFVILGGAAGAFIADGDAYAAISEAAPVESLTSAEVNSLLRS